MLNFSIKNSPKLAYYWLSRIFNGNGSIGQAKNRKRCPGHRQWNNYQHLEEKRVLATVFLDAQGVLWATGTPNDDSMRASIVQSNVRVTINNQNFDKPASQVQRLVFFGLDGNDTIINDTSLPSTMYGNGGDDVLIGGSSNDVLIGGPGNDRLEGRDGDDVLRGVSGENILLGGNGNDLIFGGLGGNNNIRGGNGNDVIFAGDQQDEIFGDAGDDQIWGGLGSHTIYSGSGKNTVMGGQGNDVIYSQGIGDWVHGVQGDDIIYANGSNGRIFGGVGNDSLYATGNNNTLFGGPGNDGFLAYGSDNTLGNTGIGKNRILIRPGRTVPENSAGNAVIRFVNATSNWNFKEMEAIDRGLRALHHRTGGIMVLKDTTSNLPLTIAKHRTNDTVMQGLDGLNELEGSFQTNSQGNIVSETYTRTIRIADFNENDSHAYRWAGLLVIHEISHNWDSEYEINRRLPDQGKLWNEFQSISSWRNTNPNSSSFTQAPLQTFEPFEYRIVNGNPQPTIRDWWYRSSSSFVRSYGTLNAKEDWAVSWEYVFMPEVYGSIMPEFQNVPAKTAKVNQLLDLMS